MLLVAHQNERKKMKIVFQLKNNININILLYYKIILNATFHIRIMMVIAVIHYVNNVNFREYDSGLWTHIHFIKYFLIQKHVTVLEYQFRIPH
jgi:hypothetical protein